MEDSIALWAGQSLCEMGKRGVKTGFFFNRGSLGCWMSKAGYVGRTDKTAIRIDDSSGGRRQTSTDAKPKVHKIKEPATPLNIIDHLHPSEVIIKYPNDRKPTDDERRRMVKTNPKGVKGTAFIVREKVPFSEINQPEEQRQPRDGRH
jgi:hypothetical protein